MAIKRLEHREKVQPLVIANRVNEIIDLLSQFEFESDIEERLKKLELKFQQADKQTPKGCGKRIADLIHAGIYKVCGEDNWLCAKCQQADKSKTENER